MAWKAGYKFYIPNKNVIWHLWDRSYRPRFNEEAEEMKKLQKNKDIEQFDSKKQGDIIRRKIYGDREYLRYLDEEWGLDVLG